MSIKGIRVRNAELMILLSLFKGTVHMNWKILEKCEMQVLLLDFEIEIWV